MKSCGLIVEYNPFHNGHVYHAQEARQETGADVLVAVMSGNFLQRGEPAIMDKFARTRAALGHGIDLVIELPYLFATQHSDLFADGAVRILGALHIDALCFGSESGEIELFQKHYQLLHKDRATYSNKLQQQLKEGLSYPEAAGQALKQLSSGENFDIHMPNNMLGMSYVKAIHDNGVPIKPYTIKRIHNNYHDEQVTGDVASATSIRKTLLHETGSLEKIKGTFPLATYNQLLAYRKSAGSWHAWEDYFPLLHYRVHTMSLEELQSIHGMTEGIESRIKRTAKHAASFHGWVSDIKTKRYTWTRIQRIFTNILTNTKKEEANYHSIGSLRILGHSQKGRDYLNHIRKDLEVPLIDKLAKKQDPLQEMEERASRAYYSILEPTRQKQQFQQEIKGPIVY